MKLLSFDLFPYGIDEKRYDSMKKSFCLPLNANHTKFPIDRVIYGIILFLIVGYILLSNPFLKIPYDVWQHLLIILSIHDEGRGFIFYPGDLWYTNPWYKAWALVLRQIGIENLFYMAKFIHTIQFLFALVLMLYSVRIMIKCLIPNLKSQHENWLVLLAVSIWFVGNGTHSEAYQQSWIAWYSINYQAVAFPLFWFMGALSVRIISKPQMTGQWLALDILFILGAAWIIAEIHALELVFYFLYVGILLLFHPERVWNILKKYYWLVLPAFMILVVISIHDVDSRFTLKEKIMASDWNLSVFLNQVLETGQWYIRTSLNRLSSTLSEAALFSLFIGLLTSGWILWDISMRKFVNTPLFHSQVFATLIFFLIPVTTIPAGLAGIVTHPLLVYRFFWGAPWFLILPVAIYLAACSLHVKSHYASGLGVTITTMIILISLYPIFPRGALYANGLSFVNMLDRKVMGPQYGDEVIRRLETMLDQRRPSAPDPEKPDMYYIRGDLGYLVRGCLRKYVYTGRFETPPRSTFFNNLDKHYRLIDIEVGPDFPKDETIISFRRYQTSP